MLDILPLATVLNRKGWFTFPGIFLKNTHVLTCALTKLLGNITHSAHNRWEMITLSHILIKVMEDSIHSPHTEQTVF